MKSLVRKSNCHNCPGEKLFFSPQNYLSSLLMLSYNNHIFTRRFLDFIRVPQGCYKVERAESMSPFHRCED